MQYGPRPHGRKPCLEIYTELEMRFEPYSGSAGVVRVHLED
jgi:hypothetical protein